MLQQRTATHTRTAVLVCLAFLALTVPASAGAGTIYTERATDHPAAATPELPQVGDRPAERAPASAAPAAATTTSSADDVDVTAIVGLSLASIGLLGFTATALHRRRRVAPGH
jgi:hypothetical protein